MKRFFIILCLIAFAGAATSCSNGHKACAAYAKHDTGNQPSYDEVQ